MLIEPSTRRPASAHVIVGAIQKSRVGEDPDCLHPGYKRAEWEIQPTD
jgi:hypothetical protein